MDKRILVLLTFAVFALGSTSAEWATPPEDSLPLCFKQTECGSDSDGAAGDTCPACATADELCPAVDVDQCPAIPDPVVCAVVPPPRSRSPTKYLYTAEASSEYDDRYNVTNLGQDCIEMGECTGE